MKCSLGISNFLEEISSLSRSIVFLNFFALITEEGFLISPCRSLELCIHMGISFIFSFAFHFLLFIAICKASSKDHFAFFISFSWGWSWLLPPVQRHERPSIFLQALCLSDLIPWMSLSLPLYNLKGFYSGHTGSSGFPYFLQFKSEFVKKEFMIWATVSSWSCFCWLCRASLSLAAKNIINLTLVLTIWGCPCVESSLVLLEEGVCYDQCVLLEKLY